MRSSGPRRKSSRREIGSLILLVEDEIRPLDDSEEEWLQGLQGPSPKFDSENVPMDASARGTRGTSWESDH